MAFNTSSYVYKFVGSNIYKHLLLKMTVETTYFTYQGKVYEQVYGMAMGSPLSPILANLFMEEFEEKALTTAPHPPKFWARYVDDTGVVTKKLHEDELFNHINRQHPSIKFTMETEVDNSLPMLDLKLNRTNNTIIADIYRKPTHTDHYLQWSSHHPVQQKLGIVCTLMHRADTIISVVYWLRVNACRSAGIMLGMRFGSIVLCVLEFLRWCNQFVFW